MPSFGRVSITDVPNMKNIFSVLFISTICLISSSCTKDDMSSENTLYGSWKMTSWELKSPIDLNNNGEATSSYTSGCLIGSDLSFTDSDTGTLDFIAEVSYNTTNEDGNLFYMTSCSINSEITASPITYTTEGSMVIIMMDGNQYVLMMEGNTLTMTVSNGFIATDIDSFVTTVSQDVKYIFTKQ